MYFLYPYFHLSGMSIAAPFPSISVMLRDWLVAMVINSTLFYWGHRLLHHPLLYKHIHKQHHRVLHPIGIAAQFAHPVEDFLCNMLPTVLGFVIMQSHIITAWIWISFRIAESIYGHCGYEFPYMPFNWMNLSTDESEKHYFHHSHNVGCYGYYWDHIMGTDVDYLKYKADLQMKRSQVKSE